MPAVSWVQPRDALQKPFSPSQERGCIYVPHHCRLGPGMAVLGIRQVARCSRGLSLMNRASLCFQYIWEAGLGPAGELLVPHEVGSADGRHSSFCLLLGGARVAGCAFQALDKGRRVSKVIEPTAFLLLRACVLVPSSKLSAGAARSRQS
ncbi:hypothetical protein NDU88_010236 [Pleurodeles waltl]|uniref:Uncharacterized protein n=1 Tax=Pleurodeles waltl TaxID=8319 RepID=A0AAV7RXL4_PLEWA|nr:hypothetical protein NDU88_010236 [Pleurodeles waltl]